MNPRSLVGMTMGARKRAARAYVPADRSLQAPQPDYRIGERLRPCICSKALCLKGCKACVPLCERCAALALVFGPGPGFCVDCWNRHIMREARCDGSGVLPARGLKGESRHG